MKELVRLRTRPSRDGKTFAYRLEYIDENGKRRRVSLGHADKQKAERQRTQTERELRMGIVEPTSMRLSKLLKTISLVAAVRFVRVLFGNVTLRCDI